MLSSLSLFVGMRGFKVGQLASLFIFSLGVAFQALGACPENDIPFLRKILLDEETGVLGYGSVGGRFFQIKGAAFKTGPSDFGGLEYNLLLFGKESSEDVCEMSPFHLTDMDAVSIRGIPIKPEEIYGSFWGQYHYRSEPRVYHFTQWIKVKFDGNYPSDPWVTGSLRAFPDCGTRSDHRMSYLVGRFRAKNCSLKKSGSLPRK